MRLKGHQVPKDLVPVAPPPSRGHPGHYLFMECRQTHRVSLTEKDERDGGGEVSRVPQLGGKVLRIRTPTHGPAYVDQHVCPQVGLRFELLDVVAVRAPEHSPVDVTQVVARLVGSQLREFGRESVVRRAVQPHDEALNHLPRNEFHTPELREGMRIQEVRPGAEAAGRVNREV